MNYKGIPEDLAVRVQPLDLSRMAAIQGWTKSEKEFPNFTLYTVKNSLDQIIIPNSIHLADYPLRVTEAIHGMASRAGKTATQVLNDLLVPRSDTLQIKVKGAETENHTLPLIRGRSLVDGVFRALQSSACSAVSAKRVHPRLKTSESDSFINRCRFGQTERGSFSLKVLCPIDVPGVPTSIFETEDFGRRVSTYFVRTLDRLYQAIEKNQITSLLETGEPDDAVVSANFCAGLLEMEPESNNSNMDISMSWSSVVPAPTILAPTQIFELRTEHFVGIEKAHSLLSSLAPDAEDTFIGIVDNMGGQLSHEDRVQGDITLRFEYYDEILRAKITLDSERYQMAHKAHGIGDFVRVVGTLKRRAKIHVIENIKDLTVISRSKK
jgi:hypothetical protein